jgi:uncharacterized damage-inducible protein DinB
MALQSLLEEVLEAWAYTRESVIEEIRNLSDRDLQIRPHAESRTALEVGHHIAESGLLMAGELSRPDGDFTRKPYPQLKKEYSQDLDLAERKPDLLQILERTHSEGARKIRDAGELHMLQLITRFDGERGTRLAWMNHGIAHEEYHRGQLALYARLAGRVPALTQKIHSRSSSA